MRRRHWWAAADASARTNCTPCQLPAGHKAAHWTACRPSPKETP